MGVHVAGETGSCRRWAKTARVILSAMRRAVEIAVAGVSFSLGVMFGQKGGALPGLAADIEKPKLPRSDGMPGPAAVIGG